MIYIGIDPGKSGGIAALTTGGLVLDVLKMPASERGVLDAMRDLARHVSVEGPAFAALEHVGPMPRQGVVSVFTFGKGYGSLTMALTAAVIPFDLVSPIRWQNAMGCRSGGDKNVTKRRAEQLFPHLTITHAIADALLLAEYCRRIREHSNGKEEDGAQGHTEAPRSQAGKGADAKRVAHQRERPTRKVAATEGSAVATSPRHGAGSRREARSPLRGHRGRAADKKRGNQR